MIRDRRKSPIRTGSPPFIADGCAQIPGDSAFFPKREATKSLSALPRDFWYRAVVPVPGVFPRGLFIEVRLFDDDAQDPWVEIVNAHPQV